jgi:serine/threonine protein kinase/tetratricopeptide (TPR) repeat protein
MKRDPEELAALSKLLDDALDLAPEQRATWIESLPDGADNLKPALRRLLLGAAGQETAEVLPMGREVRAAIACAATHADSPVLEAGSAVGPYELVRELGRGGMGTVWLARRTEGLMNRLVALKLPHTGLFHAALVERIARERDILESLTHPNIARLYDAGVTSTGQPYLALEYIEGVPLTEYCDRHSRSVRERLRLFVQVLEAIQYAHANLVIHRDIKPANILVTQKGVAVVLDFGIAKLLTEGATAETALTQFGGRALTPDYASPEQISGKTINTASDVYSLGVVLSELLCGSRPYYLKRDSRGALEDAIVEAEALAPSRNIRPEAAALRGTSVKSLGHELRGDLDNIVLKALRKDPTDRYASVEQFARDIARFTTGQTVLAHPGSTRYRAGKFLRRHKLAVASGCAVVLALSAGAGAALWQAHVARLEAARAEQVKNFTLSLLDSADTENGAGAQTTAVELLQQARARVETELGDRPAIAAELMGAIGYGLLGQGKPEDAAPLLEKSVALYVQVYGRDDVRTVGAQISYGEALVDLGRSEEAIVLLKQAIEVAHRLHDTDDEADGWRWLSMAQVAEGEFAAAIVSARTAVDRLGPAPVGRRAQVAAALAQLALANTLNSDRRPGVVDAARASLKFAELANPNAYLPHKSQARVLLGQGLIRDGQVAEGLRELTRAYSDTRNFLGADHPQTVQFGIFVANGRVEAGDLRGAIDAYRISLDSASRHPESLDPVAFGHIELGLANALCAAREREESLPHYLEAERSFAAAAGTDSPLTLGAISSRAFALTGLARLAEADKIFADLQSRPLTGTTKATSDSRLSVLRSLQGRHDEAIALARAGAEGLKTLQSKTLRAQSLAKLGSALLAALHGAEAVAPLEQGIALFKEMQLQETPERAETVAMLDRAKAAAAR